MCRDSLCGACCLPGTSQTSSESKNLLGSFPPSLKNLAVIPEQGARRAQQKKNLNKPQLNGSRRARLCPSCAGAATWGCGGETLPELGTRQRCPVGAGHVEGFFVVWSCREPAGTMLCSGGVWRSEGEMVAGDFCKNVGLSKCAALFLYKILTS